MMVTENQVLIYNTITTFSLVSFQVHNALIGVSRCSYRCVIVALASIIERGLSNDSPPKPWGIAAGVFLVQYTLYYKKSKELQLAHPAFPQGGPENI